MAVTYPADDEIHIFSSHAWRYGQHRDALHRLIGSDWIKGWDYEDLSVTRRHPIDAESNQQLACELRDIIAGVDALIIMAGMYTNNSRWMLFEIHTAFALGVPIIPVLRNGQERIPQLPTELASCEPVRWRGDSIREAILSFLPIERRRAFEARLEIRRAALRDALALGLAANARPAPPQRPPRYQDWLASALDEQPQPPRYDDWLASLPPPPQRHVDWLVSVLDAAPTLPRRTMLDDALDQIELPTDGAFGALRRRIGDPW